MGLYYCKEFSFIQLDYKGPDEGLYTWVAANYALGTLGGDPQRTTGIIKLGEDSTEVTFVPREPIPLEFSRTVKVSGVTYNLYSHSLLQFGQVCLYNFAAFLQ
ncbi:hypothetical protein AMTR_s00119p00064420 [Amborella trichopoda]|uniref:Apyrase n=1 Tax=Amborella trichopoda TaxID=13333 RepID=W1NQW8_AMBTC|nr:hypothetical protein AMTR_s00119p00064420 [Amborella trichopoda]